MNQLNVNGQKVKKPWYKKWWVWTIILIVAIVKLSSTGEDVQEVKKVFKSEQSTTAPEDSKPQETTKPADSKPKETTTPVVTTNAPTNQNKADASILNMYVALEDNDIATYTTNSKAKIFLKNNPTLFPTTSKTTASSFADTSIEYKHLAKNIENYGDKLMFLPETYVLSIQEENIDSTKKISTLHVVDELENSYVIFYFGSLGDIFEKDIISVYGLPIGISSFDNTGGGTTICSVLAGSHIEKIEE